MATRSAFSNLIDHTIEEEVSFVVIAGDLYDGDWRDYQTGLFFVRQMGRLAAAGIQVFLLYGNHDADSQITKRLMLPNNVRVFSHKKPQTFQIDELRVALHGQSFRQRDITDNLVPAYPSPLASCFNIGVLHTGLGGMDGHANYAPCAMEDLTNKGYDYWALAHVHQAAVLHERPHVVFCGNLQGRHIRECGPKGAALIAVEDGQVADVSPLQVDCVRWIHLPVRVDECSAAADAIDLVREAIEAAVARKAEGRLLVCRVELTGQTQLHGELLASADHLLAEARASALGLGEEVAWIERFVIATANPESTASRKHALGELQRMMEVAASDFELQAQLALDIGDLVRKLPHDIRAHSEDAALRAAIDSNIAGLITHAGAYLSARLGAEKV
jgi:DNA repair protein SbcD/Mre11